MWVKIRIKWFLRWMDGMAEDVHHSGRHGAKSSYGIWGLLLPWDFSYTWGHPVGIQFTLPSTHSYQALLWEISIKKKKKQVNAFLSLLTRRQQQHSVHWPLWLYRHAVTSLCSPWSLRAEASQVQRQGFVTGPLALSLSEHPLSKTVDLHTGKDVQCPIYIMRFPSTILC